MVIYLNGTSSAGKSTLACELQKQLDLPIFYFSIDTLLYSLPTQIIESLEGKQKHSASMNWVSIFQGYFSCVRALHDTGNIVIADCPVYNEDIYSFYEKNLSSVEQKFVFGVICPLSKLQERELQRKDRVVGLAEKQFKGIHKYLQYDLSMDSSVTDVTTISKELISSLKEKLKF
ncbi:MAG: hypothetical protein ABL930_04130 [Pseudobdellovibrio sp.]